MTHLNKAYFKYDSLALEMEGQLTHTVKLVKYEEKGQDPNVQIMMLLTHARNFWQPPLS